MISQQTKSPKELFRRIRLESLRKVLTAPRFSNVRLLSQPLVNPLCLRCEQGSRRNIQHSGCLSAHIAPFRARFKTDNPFWDRLIFFLVWAWQWNIALGRVARWHKPLEFGQSRPCTSQAGGNRENQTDTKGTLFRDQYRMQVQRLRQIAVTLDWGVREFADRKSASMGAAFWNSPISRFQKDGMCKPERSVRIESPPTGLGATLKPVTLFTSTIISRTKSPHLIRTDFPIVRIHGTDFEAHRQSCRSFVQLTWHLATSKQLG